MGQEDSDADMTGVGAWICMERARVAGARTGLGARLRGIVNFVGEGVGVGVDGEGDDCADLGVAICMLENA